jgi:hypothetical protein
LSPKESSSPNLNRTTFSKRFQKIGKLGAIAPPDFLAWKIKASELPSFNCHKNKVPHSLSFSAKIFQ